MPRWCVPFPDILSIKAPTGHHDFFRGKFDRAWRMRKRVSDSPYDTAATSHMEPSGGMADSSGNA
jgi:hypothetical protein